MEQAAQDRCHSLTILDMDVREAIQHLAAHEGVVAPKKVQQGLQPAALACGIEGREQAGASVGVLLGFEMLLESLDDPFSTQLTKSWTHLSRDERPTSILGISAACLVTG